MSCNKRYFNVVGAPFKVGDQVEITLLPKDETFDMSFLGKIGVVLYFEYDCGCGQTFPNDPMIGVQFSDGRLEEFWKEEISLFKKERKVLL